VRVWEGGVFRDSTLSYPWK